MGVRSDGAVQLEIDGSQTVELVSERRRIQLFDVVGHVAFPLRRKEIFFFSEDALLTNSVLHFDCSGDKAK